MQTNIEIMKCIIDFLFITYVYREGGGRASWVVARKGEVIS